MTDIAKILTSVLAGGTQAGGAGGLLGQLAGLAQGAQNAPGQAPTQQGQGGLAGLGGLGTLLGGLGGTGQGAGGLFDQIAAALRNAQAPTAPAAPSAAPGGPQPGPGNVLDQLLAALQGAQGQAGGLPGQAAELLRKYGGGFGGGAAAGVLAGLLLGTGAGRQIAGTAARLGGLAAIGGLAYVALRNFQQGKPVVEGTINDVSAILGLGAPPADFVEAAGSADKTADILLKAMVAAAYSDGELSADEREMIVGNLDSLGLGTAEKAYLDGLLSAPVALETVAAACVTDEMKAQAYLAAHLGMTVDSAAEAKFLRDFAAALGLAPDLVAHLDQAAAEAKAARAG